MSRIFSRKGGCHFSNIVIPIVSLTTAGSYFLYNNFEIDSKINVSPSIATPLGCSFLFKWLKLKDLTPCHSVAKLDYPHNRAFGLFLSNTAHVPPDDANKVATLKGVASMSISEAVAMVLPAVVTISVPCSTSLGVNGKSSCSSGSGTIINSDGTILTCAHLVLDSRDKKVPSKGKVDVTLQDGQTFVGFVLNADLHSDIAIIKIESLKHLPAAKLGSSHILRPGDQVVAIGTPHLLGSTVTAGIVSCVDRKGSEMGLEGMLREYIQIDCALNPGNSGGPLVNLNGEVVGVNVKKYKTAVGLNFAVPIDVVSRIMAQFKTNGRVVRPWLGLKMLDLNEMIIAHLKLKDSRFSNISKGVLIFMVSPGSPADLAGFHPGDVVIEFHGKPIGSINEIVEIMEDRGEIPIKVVVKRAKDTLVTLTVIPSEAIPEL